MPQKRAFDVTPDGVPEHQIWVAPFAQHIRSARRCIAGEVAPLPTDGGHSIITPSEGGRDRSYRHVLLLFLGDISEDRFDVLGIREQADDFHKPWYIIDPTGDVARKQWRQSREKKRMARSMKALKAADEDGDGAYSISELSQYTQKTRRADRRVSLVGRLAERARRQAHDAAISWDPRGFTLFP